MLDEAIESIQEALQCRQAAHSAAHGNAKAPNSPLHEVEAAITTQLQTLTDERRLLRRKKVLRETRRRITQFRQTLHTQPKRAHAQIFGKGNDCPTGPLHAVKHPDGTISTDGDEIKELINK